MACQSATKYDTACHAFVMFVRIYFLAVCVFVKLLCPQSYLNQRYINILIII